MLQSEVQVVLYRTSHKTAVPHLLRRQSVHPHHIRWPPIFLRPWLSLW